MAPNHAGARTGRIDQDAIERRALRPVGDARGIGLLQLGCHTETAHRRARALHALPVAVEADHFGQRRLALADVRELAARRTAGVEYAQARPQIEQIGGGLRSGILHAERALAPPGQLRYVACVVDAQRIRETIVNDCCDAGFRQPVDELAAIRDPAVGAQP